MRRKPKDNKSGRGPQPYAGYNDAVGRAERTMVRLAELEPLTNYHVPSNYEPLKFVRPLDTQVREVLARLSLSIADARREIASLTG